MNTHPYLRAYMAGTVVPSVFMLAVLTGFVVARLGFQIPVPVERAIIFPMALVPNLSGLWNVLWVARRPHRRWSIGVHGALLPVILIPLGMAGAIGLKFLVLGQHGVEWFHVIHVPYTLLVPWLLCVPIIYYLVWKYVVGFCNEVVGVG